MGNIKSKLLKYAKEEFLEKGYENASTNMICKNAGLTTGALFNRYKNKEELFFAVVNPVIKPIQKWMQEQCQFFFEQSADERSQLRAKPYYIYFIDYIYKHPEEFKLIIVSSNKKYYDDFLDFFVDLETKTILRYISEVGVVTHSNKKLIERIVHISMTAYFNAIFEVVKHSIPKKEALKIAENLNLFFRSGIDDLIKRSESI